MAFEKRILYIPTEMSPYLEMTEFAETINKLAILSNDLGHEVRCIMPRFGLINERRHKLHEVVKLSGLNITVNYIDYYLQIKVASLPNARLQVYFLENEDFFKRKYLDRDENDEWFEDNDLRTIFFCRGALDIVKKFAWAPDILHCSGWMTGLIPLYIKTAFKREPVFSNTKIVFSVSENTFLEKIGKNFLEKIAINSYVQKEHLKPFASNDNNAMFMGGAFYADAIVLASDNIDIKVMNYINKLKSKIIVPFKNDNDDLTHFFDIYNELALK